MKKITKISLFVLLLTSVFFITGCGKEKNIEGSLEELMEKVYAEVPEDERPMMLMNTEVTKENAEYYIGSADIEFEEALASEPAVTSIAHSVVLIRTKENADVEQIKKTIKEKVNPRKWLCVEAEQVVVESRGNLIILIMASSNVDQLKAGFNNL